MSRTDYHCQACGVALQGLARYCVRCFGERHRPCPECMQRCADGVHRVQRRGKPPRAVKCSYCHNERYILVE